MRGRVDVGIADGGAREPGLVGDQPAALRKRGRVRVKRGVGDPREVVVEAHRQRRSGVLVLPARRDPHAGELELAARDVPHLDVLRLERDRVHRLVRHRRQDRLGGRVVQKPARTPQRGVVADAERRQVREAGDVVEVKVREQDVQAIDACEDVGLLDQPCDAGPGVDHHRLVAVAQHRRRRLASVGGKPAAGSEDRQHLVNRVMRRTGRATPR